MRSKAGVRNQWCMSVDCSVKHYVKQSLSRQLGQHIHSFFHGDPFKRFASQYIAAMEARATLLRPALRRLRDSQIKRKAALMNRFSSCLHS